MDVKEIIEKYQWLKCYSCGTQKSGEMTICRNFSDPKRNDGFGLNGYSACCPKETCLKRIKIVKDQFFGQEVGAPGKPLPKESTWTEKIRTW